MGCPCSTLKDEHPIDDESGEDYSQAISQCKQRKELLRSAAEARSAFAKANDEYLQVLAKTGSALQAFCKACHTKFEVNVSGETRPPRQLRFALEYVPMASQRVVVNPSRAPPCQQYFIDNGVVFKPPPPPPGCSSHYWDFEFLEEVQKHRENEEEEQVTVRCKEVDDDDEEDDMVLEVEGDQVKCTERRKCKVESESPPCGASSSWFQASVDDDAKETEKLAVVPAKEQSAKALEEIMRYVHQEFITASRCGKAVGRMLESSNETELGLLGASAKALTWRNEDEGAMETNLGWSQALTLERLSAWERKLYEEVKALAVIHSQFNKKRKLLCKYGVNRVHDETVDKTRADTKAVETQMHVAIQATEATAAAIQKITNEELHFQLVELLHGLGEMWRTVQECHERQRTAVMDLSISGEYVSCSSVAEHRNSTRSLKTALLEWQGCMKTLALAEEEYVRSIGKWLQASFRRGQQSRRQLRLMHLAIPEIYYLCQEWEKSVEGLSQRQRQRQALTDFIDMVREVERFESEEMKAGKVVEGLVKELSRKVASVESSERRKKDSSGSVCEKRAAVKWMKQQIEMEKGETEKLSSARRACIVRCVEKGLPRVFDGVYEFARACFEVHRELHDRAKQGIKLTVVK